MKKTCDNCKKSVKKVGKLIRVGYFYLCKYCRKKLKRRQIK